MIIVRYFFVGSMAAATDIGLFSLLVVGFGFPWFPVASISFLLATGVNYYLSIRLVFESGVRFSRGNEFLLVFAVSFIGLVMNQSVLWLFIELMNFNVVFAKVAATAVVFFWNYGARHGIIFRKRDIELN